MNWKFQVLNLLILTDMVRLKYCHGKSKLKQGVSFKTRQTVSLALIHCTYYICLFKSLTNYIFVGKSSKTYLNMWFNRVFKKPKN